MSRHRAQPPRRRAEPAGRRRAEPLSRRDVVQPRYGRLAVLGASVSVTGIAMLGGIGVLPSVASGGTEDSGTTARDPAGVASSAQPSVEPSAQESVPTVVQAPVQVPPSSTSAEGGSGSQTPKGGPRAQDVDPLVPPVPPDSGEGRRVVFDESAQRVWLVGEDEQVERTYLVSGSVYDNLDPGTYEVYSRSESAVGIDDSGTMQWFVRFTQGDNGAAIGFHDIPVDDGEPVQTRAQLGTPQSHGCIRQERDDAVALWEFAPIGTEVDVVA